MTEEDSEKAEEAVQVFLEKVRRAFREMQGSLTEEQFEEYARPKAQDNLSLWSPWMNSNNINPWTDIRRGPGFGPHGSGNDGTPFPACHICGGLKPGSGAQHQFIASAVGHQEGCPYG